MERLWSRVDRTGSCWLWQGATINGYGVIQRGGRGQGLIKVHVAAWESVNGEKPPGLDIRHQCDVRLCCNPTHLSIGTRAEICKMPCHEDAHVEASSGLARS